MYDFRDYFLGKTLLLKEVCIREVDILEDRWRETKEFKSSGFDDEEGGERGKIVNDVCFMSAYRCNFFCESR